MKEFILLKQVKRDARNVIYEMSDIAVSTSNILRILEEKREVELCGELAEVSGRKKVEICRVDLNRKDCYFYVVGSPSCILKKIYN